MTPIFFLNWSERVDPSLIQQFECINFHCAPLPYGRGGHPIENMILLGHGSTVITAHRMTDEMDAGPIYAVSESVSLEGSKREIQARMMPVCADLIRLILDTQPTPQPQVGEVVTFKRLSPNAFAQFWAARG